MSLRKRVTQQVTPVVKSLIQSVVSEELGTDHPDHAQHIDDTTTVMTERIEMMPTFLSMPMVLMTAVFDAYGVTRKGKPFHRQTLEQQIQQVHQWKHSPIGSLRDFIDFYEKMGTFVYYCQLENTELGRHE